MFILPSKIEYVLNTLIKNGHKAYIVGGCVRDLLCGKTPHDFDITTSATPDETQNLFEKTVATGIKHGTVTVIIDGEPIEVTTFRTESAYNDSRHPESVNFVREVEDDLSRRDFTVNAMCYNHNEGLIDLFGGKNDIEKRILRAVGNAETRFCEDALRILRLFRFAATLSFKIKKQTLDAAIKCAPLLKNISAERIFTELKKTACGNDVEVISPLLKTDCLADYYISDGNLQAIKNLDNNQNLRTFVLLFTVSTNFEKTLEKLKCSNAFTDYCLKLSALALKGIKCDKVSIKQALNYADFDIVYDCFSYLNNVSGIDVTAQKKILSEIKDSNEPYKISQLDITGDDVASLGYNGKVVGEKLNYLLGEVIKNPSLNTKVKLLNLICN